MSTRRYILPFLLILGLGTVSGCVVRAGFGARVNAPPPGLVAIDGGVYVVEGYNRPIFWDAGYYWWNDGGYWYRSSYYDRGFARVSMGVVPYRVRGIRSPRRYVNYRPRGQVVRRRAVGSPAHRSAPHRAAPRRHTPAPRPAVRDHRSNERVKVRDNRQPAPRVRDHRRD